MGVTAKKLGQTALNVSGSVVTLATGVAGGVSEVTLIIIANTNTTTARKVTILAHGTGTSTANMIVPEIEIPAKGQYTIQLNNSPIILSAGETLRAYQNEGTDVTVTVYGIEEV